VPSNFTVPEPHAGEELAAAEDPLERAAVEGVRVGSLIGSS
jgi:hypothetical protein